MRPTTSVILALIGALFILPMLASGEELGTSGNAGANASVRETATGKADGRLNKLPTGTPAAENRAAKTSSDPKDCIGDTSGKPDCVSKPEANVKGETTNDGSAMERLKAARERVQEKRGEILKRMVNMMTKRMNAAIDRLTKIADRLDSRIAKEKARGVDTSTAETKLAAARTKLAEAKTAVSAAETVAIDAIKSADVSTPAGKPADAGKPVREALNKAKEAVFATHKALVEATSSLKGKRNISEDTTMMNGSVTP